MEEKQKSTFSFGILQMIPKLLRRPSVALCRRSLGQEGEGGVLVVGRARLRMRPAAVIDPGLLLPPAAAFAREAPWI